MPTTLPARRRPPRRDLGAVICLALACAPAALVAMAGGRPPVDPENYAHLDDRALPGASRLAAIRSCPDGEGSSRASGTSTCRTARSRLAGRMSGRD